MPTDAQHPELRPFIDERAIDALAAWMAESRWFPLKDARPRLSLERVFELSADTAILLVRADDVLLQVPVAWRTDPGAAPIAHLDDRWLVDACHDRDAVAAIMAVAAGADTVSGLTGEALGEVGALETVSVIAGEQSNTSIVGRGSAPTWIAKVFRVVEPGDNPDVIVTGALTRAGCDRVPSLVAALSGSWTAGDASVTGHLLAVSRFVEGAEDAWTLFGEHAIAVLGGHEPSAAPDAEALGAAVASVHAELAEALGAEQASEADTLRFVAGLERRIAWARDAAADVLEDLDERLERAIEALREIDTLGELQQIHGDLHLGQVLRSPEQGFLLLDFEGEPLRPLHERMVREPRARDLVGMVRSFDYAAGFAMQSLDDADAAAATAWVDGRVQEFLDGYRGVAGAFDEHAPVFRALLLDKALYEVVYELRNRPSWVAVPLGAVRRLLGAV